MNIFTLILIYQVVIITSREEKLSIAFAEERNFQHACLNECENLKFITRKRYVKKYT